jgi:hypothetical protein
MRATGVLTGRASCRGSAFWYSRRRRYCNRRVGMAQSKEVGLMINDDELVSVLSGKYKPDTQSKK